MPNQKNAVSKDVKQTLPVQSMPVRGLEDVEMNDIIIPRIKLMQPLSPELENDESLEKGDMINSVTGEKFPKELVFVPIKFIRSRIKFLPREKGGGIDCRSSKGRKPDQGKMYKPYCADCQYSKWNEAEKKPPECTEMLNFICFVPEEADIPFITISFAKTSFTAGKKLLSIAKFRGADLFRFRYMLKTKKVKDDKGLYYVFEVSALDVTPDDDYKTAEKLFNELETMDYDIHQSDVPEEEETLKNPADNAKTEEPAPF